MEIKDCICIEAPMGYNGLEGYLEKEKYKYEFKEKDWRGQPYYRIYFPDDLKSYETCGVETFKRFFAPLLLPEYHA